jgi:hypothetical protein
MNPDDLTSAKLSNVPLSRDKMPPADLLRQYGCGPVTFTGDDLSLYERHMTFDRVAPIAKASARDKFEAAARSPDAGNPWIRLAQSGTQSSLLLVSRNRYEPRR